MHNNATTMTSSSDESPQSYNKRCREAVQRVTRLNDATFQFNQLPAVLSHLGYDDPSLSAMLKRKAERMPPAFFTVKQLSYLMRTVEFGTVAPSPTGDLIIISTRDNDDRFPILGSGQLRVEAVLLTVLSYVDATTGGGRGGGLSTMMAISSVSRQWRYYSGFMPQWRMARLAVLAPRIWNAPYIFQHALVEGTSGCLRRDSLKILLLSTDEPPPAWLTRRKEESISCIRCCAEPLLTTEAVLCLPCYFGSALFHTTASYSGTPGNSRDFITGGVGCLALCISIPVVSNLIMACVVTQREAFCPWCAVALLCPVCYVVRRWRQVAECGGSPFTLCSVVEQRPLECYMA